MTLLRSGGVFYGGLILAVVVAFWYIASHRLPFWTSCDVFAPGIALGHITGRLGCLAAGCCYGKPTDVAWAITFTDPLAAANVGTPLGIPLHPTQLYEAGAELLILGLLLLDRTSRPDVRGTHVLGLHVPLRGLALHHRVLSWRSPRQVLGFSTSQFISLVLGPLSLVMLIWLAEHGSDGPQETQRSRKRGVAACLRCRQTTKRSRTSCCR